MPFLPKGKGQNCGYYHDNTVVPLFQRRRRESISDRSTTMFEGQLIFVKSKFIGSISENAVNNINTQSKKEE